MINISEFLERIKNKARSGKSNLDKIKLDSDVDNIDNFDFDLDNYHMLQLECNLDYAMKNNLIESMSIDKTMIDGILFENILGLIGNTPNMNISLVNGKKKLKIYSGYFGWQEKGSWERCIKKIYLELRQIVEKNMEEVRGKLEEEKQKIDQEKQELVNFFNEKHNHPDSHKYFIK